MDGDAGRELAARAEHLLEREPVAADAEDRDRVAAGVHCDQQPVADEHERALRGEAIGLGARKRRASEPAGRVRARARERAVRVAVVDRDLVAGRLVRLHEDGASGRPRGRAPGERQEHGRKQP